MDEVVPLGAQEAHPEDVEVLPAHVLGAQGNVWTEFMKTPERVEYMAYPRALAMAERAADVDPGERVVQVMGDL